MGSAAAKRITSINSSVSTHKQMAACEVTSNAHRTLQQSGSVLKIVRSTMRNRTTTHSMPETTAFASLFGFQKIAHQVSCASKTFIPMRL